MATERITFHTVTDAHHFLRQLGAPEKLIRHVMLVGEAADLLIEKLRELPIDFDEHFVRLGVAIHDAGKIQHLTELTAQGNNHEPAGQELLLSHSVDPKLARCCLSHARWSEMTVCFEELLVALADTLWKGKRNDTLENLVIDHIANQLSSDRWSIFIELDSCFEKIASTGENRLARS